MIGRWFITTPKWTTFDKQYLCLLKKIQLCSTFKNPLRNGFLSSNIAFLKLGTKLIQIERNKHNAVRETWPKLVIGHACFGACDKLLNTRYA